MGRARALSDLQAEVLMLCEHVHAQHPGWFTARDVALARDAPARQTGTVVADLARQGLLKRRPPGTYDRRAGVAYRFTDAGRAQARRRSGEAPVPAALARLTRPAVPAADPAALTLGLRLIGAQARPALLALGDRHVDDFQSAPALRWAADLDVPARGGLAELTDALDALLAHRQLGALIDRSVWQAALDDVAGAVGAADQRRTLQAIVTLNAELEELQFALRWAMIDHPDHPA